MIKNIKENQTNRCLHCQTQLAKSVHSTMCKKCRMKGHKEFITCDKCVNKSTNFSNAGLTTADNSVGKHI